MNKQLIFQLKWKFVIFYLFIIANYLRSFSEMEITKEIIRIKAAVKRRNKVEKIYQNVNICLMRSFYIARFINLVIIRWYFLRHILIGIY